MTARFVSFQVIFRLIRAEHDLRTARQETLPTNTNTVAFPNTELPSSGQGIPEKPHQTNRASNL